MKSLKLKSELLDKTVLVSESDEVQPVGIPYSSDKDCHVESFLDDGIMVCSQLHNHGMHQCHDGKMFSH